MSAAIAGGFCMMSLSRNPSAGSAAFAGCMIGAMLGAGGGLFGMLENSYRFVGDAMTILGGLLAGYSGLPSDPTP